MNARFLWSILAISLSVFVAGATQARAASCNASNDVGDRCSISCPTGQAAECRNGTGASSPTCECRGNLNFNISYSAQAAIGGGTGSNSRQILQHDVRAIVNQKLSSLGDYELDQSCQRERVGRVCEPNLDPCITEAEKEQVDVFRFCPVRKPDCGPVYGTVCRAIVGKLKLGDSIVVEEGPLVTLEEPNWNDIPLEYIGFREVYSNCSNEDQSFTYQHQDRTTVGAKVSKDETVTTGREISVSVSAEFKPGGIGGGANAGFTFSNSISISNASEETHQKEQSLLFSLPVKVSKMTETTVTHYWIRRVVPVKYSGVVRLDGALAQNRAGLSTVSQVLTDPKDRTFSFRGTISHAALMEGKTSTSARKLNASECKDPVLSIYSEPIDQ